MSSGAFQYEIRAGCFRTPYCSCNGRAAAGCPLLGIQDWKELMAQWRAFAASSVKMLSTLQICQFLRIHCYFLWTQGRSKAPAVSFLCSFVAQFIHSLSLSLFCSSTNAYAASAIVPGTVLRARIMVVSRSWSRGSPLRVGDLRAYGF